LSVNILKEIHRVFSIQASSIRKAEKSIGSAYRDAVTMIVRCKGKVVLTGVGKSGLVAQKIASTFSSTGTPAIYLHPTEGLHGNLGVVNKQDVVVAIGKSGESEELLNILPAIKKIGARIIAITGNRKSSLARLSNLVIYVPYSMEACPFDLAPTTSSTVSLVIGDALAISLMKLRGFTKAKFALFHPGGTLGKRLLLKVSDVMRGGRRNPVIRVDRSIHHLLVEISRKWAGAASIVDKKGKLIGIVTDFDIREAFAKGKNISRVYIKDLMHPNPTFVYSDALAVKCLELMESRKKPLTVLPVVDRKKKSVGMIHIHDLVVKGLIQDSDSRF